MQELAKARRNSHFEDEEPPPDLAIGEAVRRSRELDPWGVMAFEFRIVLRGVEKAIEHAMQQLRREAAKKRRRSP